MTHPTELADLARKTLAAMPIGGSYSEKMIAFLHMLRHMADNDRIDFYAVDREAYRRYIDALHGPEAVKLAKAFGR